MTSFRRFLSTHKLVTWSFECQDLFVDISIFDLKFRRRHGLSSPWGDSDQFLGLSRMFHRIRRFRWRVTYSASGILTIEGGLSTALFLICVSRKVAQVDTRWHSSMGKARCGLGNRHHGLTSGASLSQPTRALLQDRNIPAGSCELSLHAFPSKSHGTPERHSCQWNSICSSLLPAPRLDNGTN
jgi:hypothetical protein